MAASNAKSYQIVAQAATEIVSQKLEILLYDPVYVGCLSVETRAKETKAKLAVIQEFLSAQYGQCNPPAWLGRLLQAMYDAEEFIDKCQLRGARERHNALHVATRPLTALVSKYMLWRDLSYLAKDLDKLCPGELLTGKKEAEGERKKEPASSSSQASVPWQGENLGRLTTIFGDGQAWRNCPYGKAEKEEEIMKRIRENATKKEKEEELLNFIREIVAKKQANILNKEMEEKLIDSIKEIVAKKEIEEELMNFDRKIAEIPIAKVKVKEELMKQKEELINFTKNKLSFTKKEELMQWHLKSTPSGVHMILILGKQGVGKTFLARWVYREARYYVRFDWCAWVLVSTCKDQREFLLEILKQVENLRTEEKDMTLHYISKMLGQKLMKTKRFLLVLDDMDQSNERFLRGLVMIIPPSSQGHIIITTRDNAIAPIMNLSEAESIELGHLSDDESQRMFATKLHGVTDVQSLTQEEKNILKWCLGLPLYISLLGGLLVNAGEHERIALLKDSSTMTSLDILQLSCHSLPGHLKPCFIYMALFPVAAAIPTRRLVRLWLAEGLLDAHCYDREQKRTRLPEEVGEMFILELADRNVIDVVSWRADGFPKACQMLASLYDMIRPTAMSTGFLHIHAASKSNNETGPKPTSQRQQPPAQPLERARVRCLAEHTNIVIDDSRGSYLALNLNHVRSFLSFCLRRGMLTKDISKLLSKLTSKTDYSLLRVLDLEGVYKPSLQGVLHKLVLLKYLGLRSTVLDSIPSAVADLQYLETLDIKDTNITSLPSSFWKARNLRHLHLNWFCINFNNILKACSNNVMALTKLQTLSGLVIGEVNENLMRDHADSLTTLTTLKLFLQHLGQDTAGAAGDRVADWISSRLTNLQSLTLGVFKKKPTKPFKPMTRIGPIPKLSLAKHHHGLLELYLLGQLKKPIWSRLLPRSLKVLTLSGSEVEPYGMAELGNLLRNLRTLRLLANSYLGTHLRFNGFPSLMILKIWKLPQLKEVIIEHEAMPRLKELEFRRLDGMKDIKGIKECEELENIYVVVKEGADDFVDHLENLKRERTYLYKIEHKKPGSMDETPQSTDEDDGCNEDYDEDKDEDEDNST